ncbi:MAG: nitroreductase family protein [Gordonia sp. (in: high G+C Gram-positive bacteria)]
MTTATTQIHPLLAGRASPGEFDAAHTLTGDDLTVLLDAARWAPSAGNSQPWGFLPALRGSDEHARIVERLAASSARWAPAAGALIVTAAKRQGDGMLYSEFADYDLGQAVAHLTVQAQAMGLATHQFRAFDLDALTTELRPHDGWQIMSIIAVGRPAAGDSGRLRARRSAVQLVSEPWRN